MAKYPTNPTLYDNVNQISITKLKEWNYLQPKQIFKGVITWSIKGNETASISFLINTNTEHAYIILDYKYKDKPITYKVELITQQSNLGKGYYYYFVCPVTKKKARKLFLVGGYFLHRTAFNGCVYEKQIQSKYYRHLDKEYSSYFLINELYSKIYEKYFKTHYAGKPTKKYLKILSKIKKAEQIEISDLKI